MQAVDQRHVDRLHSEVDFHIALDDDQLVDLGARLGANPAFGQPGHAHSFVGVLAGLNIHADLIVAHAQIEIGGRPYDGRMTGLTCGVIVIVTLVDDVINLCTALVIAGARPENGRWLQDAWHAIESG